MKTLLLIFCCLGPCACHQPQDASTWKTFSVYLYPGEKLLVLANNHVLLDTVGLPTKKLSDINLPIRKEGLRRLRFLTTFRRHVYPDTTLAIVQNLELVGFSKPFNSREVQASPPPEVLSLPPLRAPAEPFERFQAHRTLVSSPPSPAKSK